MKRERDEELISNKYPRLESDIIDNIINNIDNINIANKICDKDNNKDNNKDNKKNIKNRKREREFFDEEKAKKEEIMHLWKLGII
jgi:hypothetical protein